MVIAQAGLGLRLGELLALRLEDVDFLRRTVRVEWQTTIDGKHRDATQDTEVTPSPCRCPAVVADALAAHIAECPPSRGRLAVHDAARTAAWRHEYYGHADRSPRPCARPVYRRARRATI